MDDIYKGLSKEEKIEMVYDLTLQNTNGRETALEMYRLGIEACYEELCEVKETTSENSLHKYIVSNSAGKNVYPCCDCILPKCDLYCEHL